MRPVFPTVAALALCLALVPTANALNMRTVVRYALENYPSIVAAQAERSVATLDIQKARGKHYPTVDLAGARRLDGESDNRLGPRVRLNLYASGAINAEVDREKLREQAAGSRVVLAREGHRL